VNCWRIDPGTDVDPGLLQGSQVRVRFPGDHALSRDGLGDAVRGPVWAWLTDRTRWLSRKARRGATEMTTAVLTARERAQSYFDFLVEAPLDPRSRAPEWLVYLQPGRFVTYG
jgi:hypothetical protein